MANDEKDNLISSPISALITSALLGYGADGETREELEAALNLPMNEKFIMRSFYDFIRYLNVRVVNQHTKYYQNSIK